MGIGGNKNEFGSIVDFTGNNSGFDLLKYMVKQMRTKDTAAATGPYVAKVLRVVKVNSEDIDIDWLTQMHHNQNAVDKEKPVKPINPLDFKNRIIIYGRITNEVLDEQFNMHGMLPDPSVYGTANDIENNKAIENIIRLHSRFVAMSDDLSTPAPGDYVWVDFLNKDRLNQGIYISLYKNAASGQITCDSTCATDAFKKAVPTGSFSKSTSLTSNDPERFKREKGSFSFPTKGKGIELLPPDPPPVKPPPTPPTPPDKKPFPATQTEPVAPSEPEEQPKPSATDPPQDAATGAPTANSKNITPSSPQTKKSPPATPSCLKTATEGTSLNKTANATAETTKSTSQIPPTWLFDGLSYETNFGYEDKRVRFNKTRSVIADNQYIMFVLHEPGANNASGFTYARKKIKKANEDKGKTTDAMHFFMGAAGEVFQIQSLKNKSNHANIVNSFSTGVETVGQGWYNYIKNPKKSSPTPERCVIDAKNNLFIVGDIKKCLKAAGKSYKNNKHHFLGSGISEKVKKQRKEITLAHKQRLLSEPIKNFDRDFIHAMTRSMPNEVSFRRIYELWVYLCSEDNPDKNLFHNGFRQKKTAACINDPEGHGTGFMRQDIYLNKELTPKNSASSPKAFAWGQKLLTDSNKDARKPGGPGYPSVRNSQWKAHWNADKYVKNFRSGKINASQIIEKEPWFQGVVCHCFWGGPHHHVDGWNLLYYFLCRWLGMTSEDSFFATIGAYMTVRIGGVLEGISTIPASQRLLPGYVYYPNHPGVNYVQIGKKMLEESKFYTDGYYNLNPHIKGNSNSSLQEGGSSTAPEQTTTGKMAAFPRSVIFESDTRYPKQEDSGIT
jgi:hypothetical protein